MDYNNKGKKVLRCLALTCWPLLRFDYLFLRANKVPSREDTIC